jgi:glycosyltransferase involved in cell wall biosynthesis
MMTPIPACTTSVYDEHAFSPPKSESAVTKRLPPDISVLFLVDQLSELGGGERAVFQLAQELSKFGIRITVVTFRGNLSPEALRLYEPITILPLSSCFSFRAIAVAWQLRRVIHENKISLVQTFFESSDIFGATVARICGVSCIISSRRDMGILRSAKHRLAYRLASRIYSRVICVSEQVREWHMREDHLRKDQTLAIHNGTDLSRFADTSRADSLRQQLGIPAMVPVVLTVANINYWKGIDVFIECAAVVLQTHPSAAFVVTGDWTDVPLVDVLRERANKLGTGNNVIFTGRVEDIPSLLLTSDVFALLSRSEGFPNVVIEAMAASLPVVATSVGGTPEAVDDRVTGFLVNNENSAAAAAHICRLLDDAELRRRMGCLGRERVERDFSIQQMVVKHMEVYDALLRDRR